MQCTNTFKYNKDETCYSQINTSPDSSSEYLCLIFVPHICTSYSIHTHISVPTCKQEYTHIEINNEISERLALNTHHLKIKYYKKNKRASPPPPPRPSPRPCPSQTQGTGRLTW